MSSSRLLVLALLALQPWSGAARHLRGSRRLEADDKPPPKPAPPTPKPPTPEPPMPVLPPEIREALNDAVEMVDDGGLYSDDEAPEPPLTPAIEDVGQISGEEEAEAHAHEEEEAYEYAGDDEEQATWFCDSDGCHRVTDQLEDRELRVAALREEFYEAGLKPFSKSADDPRDEDIAFFYAEEANHDAEEAIFQELYGTSTTTVPPPGW